MASANSIPQPWNRIPHCYLCDSPLRCLSYTGRGYTYYGHGIILHKDCPHIKLNVRSDVLTWHWERVLASVRLTPEWRKLFYDHVRSEDEVLELRRRRDWCKEQIRRINKIYQRGTISDNEYDALIAQSERELASLGQPEHLDTIHVPTYCENLLTIWEVATPKERRGWIVQFLRGAYCNCATDTWVLLEPHSAFQVLFREAGFPEPEPGRFDVKALGAGLRRPERKRKATPEQVAEIKRLRKEQGLSLRQLGKRFGISHERVRQLLNETG